MDTNFQKVAKLVGSGRLILIGILATVRSNSTIISKYLASHPMIQGECLQPFHLTYTHPYSPPSDREEIGYGRILSAYESLGDSSPSTTVRLVVKEMSRNIATGDPIRRWNSVVEKCLVTIRNPILSVESLIRLNLRFFFEEMPEGFHELAKSYAGTHGLEVTQHYLDDFLNLYARDHGFVATDGSERHFRMMAQRAIEEQDYRSLADLLLAFEPFEDLNTRIPRMQRHYLLNLEDGDAQLAGYSSLNHFAGTTGFQSWDELQSAILENGDFGLAQGLLDVIYSTSITGWFNLGKLMNEESRALIIEGSVMRTMPDTTLSQCCKYVGIDENPAETIENLSHNDVFSTDQSHMEAHYIASQERTVRSRTIEPPVETPARMECFPEHIQNHILNDCIPVYIQMLSHADAIRPQTEAEITDLLDGTIGNTGRTLADIDPVVAYALIATSREMSRKERRNYLAKIRFARAPQFGSVFGRISDLTDATNAS